MSDDSAKIGQATSAETLKQHIMDCSIAKSEAEWWARQQIFTLVVALQELTRAAKALGLEGDTLDLAKSATAQFEE